MKAVFLDRDGTVNVGVPKYQRIDNLDKVELLPNTLEALALLAELEYGVFFVTNQSGLSEGLITHEDFHEINNKILELIDPTGIKIIETYYCPHDLKEKCNCHKPAPKMLLDAAKKYNVDLSDSYMVGDRSSDVQTGINAGTKTVFVSTGEELEAPYAGYMARDLLEAIRYIGQR